MNAPAESLYTALRAVGNQRPSDPALVCADRSVTHRELWSAADRLAARLRGSGIGTGDRVICAVSNRPEYFAAMLAVWACEAIHVAVDHGATSPELSAIVARTQAAALIGEGAACRATRPALDSPRALAVIDADDLAWDAATGGGDTSPPPANGATGPSRSDGPRPDQAAFIFLSSGTTGQPKATMGFHGNLCGRWRRLANWLRFGPEDVHLAHLPLSHGFGVMMAITGWLAGGRLVLLRRFSSEEALQVIGAHRVTVLNGAPVHFRLLLSRLDPSQHDISTLRFSVGSAACFPPSLLEAIWERLGVSFMYMYGASEGVGVATTDRDDMLRGAVGRPAPGSVAIVGSDRRELPRGETGEIAFSRGTFPVKYWDASTAEAASVTSEWYYSGDLGRMDEAGRLYVFGRLKQQIDRGGLKIDPVEVERALLRTPLVADTAVVGVPHPVLGEQVCAYVVAADSHAPSLDELRAALARELTAYKLPELLRIVDEIPRTAIGKIDLDRLGALVCS